MKQVAFIKQNGEVAYVSSPGSDDQYIDGQTYGEYLAKDIPYDADPILFISSKYWGNGQWQDKPPSPGPWYYWSNGEWVVDLERVTLTLKTQRNMALLESDWTQLPDSPLSDDKKLEWAKYRQALRDFDTSGITDPSQVIWPTQPT